MTTFICPICLPVTRMALSRGGGHDGGAVLVVVEHGDVAHLLQAALHLETAGAAMSSRLMPPKLLEIRAMVSTSLSRPWCHTDGEGVHPAELLEEGALALHHRHTGGRADVPRPSTAEPSVITATDCSGG